MLKQLNGLVCRSRSKQGSALLIILGFVTLLTVLVVSLLLTTRFERSASSLALGRAQADVLADYAADVALERLREVIDEGRQFNTSYYTTWASEPGRIHVFTISQADGSITRVARDMFSAPPGPDAESANVDLNKAGLSGNHPVTGTAAGVMKVGWLPVLADPNQPASKANPAIGRFAYWVDDESCKVNINTADGSRKVSYNADGSVKSGDISRYFGFGTPSEISLEALGVSNATATGIADYAGEKGFNSAAEVGRASGVPSGLFQGNRFNMTHTSRSPEINMFGEPRIYLFPVLAINGVTQCMSVGGYGNYTDAPVGSASTIVQSSITGPINFVYPISALAATMTSAAPYYGNARNQLPVVPQAYTGTVNLPLAQFLSGFSGDLNLRSQGVNFNSTLNNYPLGQRIAKYLEGYNSQNQAITWPQFAGSTANGFAGKYSRRQINSIALQIIDLANGSNVMPDQNRLFSQPGYMVRGFLSDPNPSDPYDPANTPRLVYGLGRAPKITELRFIVSNPLPSDILGSGTPQPNLTMQVMVETYLPTYYAGVPLDYSYTSISDLQFGTPGGNTTPKSLNEQDLALYNTGSANTIQFSDTPSSPMNTLWMNKMLFIGDQNDSAGSPSFSGVDLMAWPKTADLQPHQTPAQTTFSADPDQNMAAQYHPYCYDAGQNKYTGANPSNASPVPGLVVVGPAGSFQTWSPGAYHSSPSLYRNTVRVASLTTSSYKIRGGVAIYTRTGSGAGNSWEVTPLDSLRGSWTSELVAGKVPAALEPVIQNAVIPVNFSVGPLERVTYSMQVADPLVNKFPGDWQIYTSPASGIVTLLDPFSGNSTTRVYRKGGASAENPDFPRSANPQPPSAGGNPNPTSHVLPTDFDGDNISYRPDGGGDPLSVWLPTQDIRLPKQARLPSIGALNFVRTGMIPDDETVPLTSQHGTPWRSISFDSISGGQTTSRGRYPDWAMLDLFAVPFLQQEPYVVDTSGNPVSGTIPPIRALTFGGSTEGKININNPSVPYPFSQSFSGVSQTPPTRVLPMNALFYGLQPSNSYNPSTRDPIYTAVDPSALTLAVQSYLSTNGPFMLPGELANVPAIANFTYRGVAAGAQSRNDLLKSVMGAICTQSNTYSIWIVAQTFKKAPGNTDYSKFEPGDKVTGEERKRIIVERYIDVGKDGVPGNASNKTYSGRAAAGPDGIVGTPDDELDADYNPPMTYPLPYRWKVLSSEDSNS